MIDEFQDTSAMQYDLLRVLASHNRITIVGDEDQVELILEFIFLFNFSVSNIFLSIENCSERSILCNDRSQFSASMGLTFLDLNHFVKIFQTTNRLTYP